MKNLIVVILLLTSTIIFAKKDKENSVFTKKGNRGISYVGFTKAIDGDVSKNGLDLGGEYLYYLDNDIYVGMNMDYSLFFYSFGGENYILSLTNLMVEGVIELQSTAKYSFEAILGAGLSIFNISQVQDTMDTFSVGIRYNYNPIVISLKYNMIGITGDQFQTIGLTFGFLIDLRPKKLNKGYYNDEF